MVQEVTAILRSCGGPVSILVVDKGRAAFEKTRHLLRSADRRGRVPCCGLMVRVSSFISAQSKLIDSRGKPCKRLLAVTSTDLRCVQYGDLSNTWALSPDDPAQTIGRVPRDRPLLFRYVHAEEVLIGIAGHFGMQKFRFIHLSFHGQPAKSSIKFFSFSSRRYCRGHDSVLSIGSLRI